MEALGICIVCFILILMFSLMHQAEREEDWSEMQWEEWKKEHGEDH